jgi:hypothetical protein
MRLDELAFQAGVLTCKGLAYAGAADSLIEQVCKSPTDHAFIVQGYVSLCIYAFFALHVVVGFLRSR